MLDLVPAGWMSHEVKPQEDVVILLRYTIKGDPDNIYVSPGVYYKGTDEYMAGDRLRWSEAEDCIVLSDPFSFTQPKYGIIIHAWVYLEAYMAAKIRSGSWMAGEVNKVAKMIERG